MTSFPYRRRAGSLARTFVVAVATLAILLVCFSMYQYSQVEPTVPLTPRAGRLPVPGEVSPTPLPASTAEPSGVMVDGAVIGASKNVTISLYQREGRDSKLELTVSDWSPRAGSDHEFTLRDPEIRMRTAEGNDVRVKADDGMLEARRRSGSGLEPQRGSLTGNVLIEFDRRTQDDKAKLSEPERNEPREYDLVRVQAHELQFDVEFGRLIIPGKITLHARDASLDALDMEMQFNQDENRIESLRIEHGGRIQLHGQSEGLGIAMGDRGALPGRRTLVDWLRETMQARIDAQAAAQNQKADEDRQPESRRRKDRAFSSCVSHAQPPRVRTAASYLARFEGEWMPGSKSETSHVPTQADWLKFCEIFPSMKTSPRINPQQVPRVLRGKGGSSPPSERIVLSWTGNLLSQDRL
jgi:hypothetical protein